MTIEDPPIEALMDSDLFKSGIQWSQPLQAHLGELRDRIIFCSVAVVVAMVAAFVFVTPLIQWMKAAAPPTVVFVQLTPGEVLNACLKLAFFSGLGLASPVILYHLLRFVLPGLTQRERQIVLFSVVGGTVLFVLGVWFGYWAVLPPALTFLVEFGQDLAQSQMSIARYVEFCEALLLLIGVSFELPVVLFLLSIMGLITSYQLIQRWRSVLVGLFIAAAVLTPSQDPISMLVVGAALSLLYVLSIIPIRLMESAKSAVAAI